MEDNIKKIYGLIGYGLMAYYYYYNRNDKYSNIILIGYIVLTLVYVPWFLKYEIRHKPRTDEDIQDDIILEEFIKKIGYSLIGLYYANKLTYKVELHSLLGLVGNLLILSKYKKYANIILLIYYIESIMHNRGNIGITSLILHYYYQLYYYQLDNISNIV